MCDLFLSINIFSINIKTHSLFFHSLNFIKTKIASIVINPKSVFIANYNITTQ
ncbi:MAG: hypothetical protein KatS3mg001_507 [Candidatus Pacearchaeota archaeon]|nr:MAG: hypothetical protein KatS3mg001_507 [Candidatus Pacearchaeota archaeon]